MEHNCNKSTQSKTDIEKMKTTKVFVKMPEPN